jgi:hypothetical protein
MCKNLGKMKHFCPRIHPQECYGHGGWWILKRTSNCIFYYGGGSFNEQLAHLVHGFVDFPTEISKLLAEGETLEGNICPHRPDMEMGVEAY